MSARNIILDDDPLWYKDAVIYQLHIRAFYDSNDDGIGDFRGLIKKLDYLEGLGVTAIWLLPFYPSPLKDDGYDIADYLNINTDYGNLRDFREFLKESHKRGIRVITELVLNHTSDQHAWFQRARRARQDSVWKSFYVWSDKPESYKDARVIFIDFEPSNWAWDPAAKAYYWHRFYSHQPDLNFDNPLVQKTMLRTLDFWLNMGVDGLRLDAVPYLFEREGTNCENLPETHQFLKKLRAHIDSKYSARMLLAEANQWPEDAAAYFGENNECHMAFHFPVMPRIFMALQMEDRFPIIDILSETPDIPSLCQWAMFLRNHDELTLEMVTDEERDYMYRVYARDPKARINLGIRRRLAPLMGNSRRKIELMNILLLSLPGTPVIYYGDEIGMGDNYYLGDRNGVRTPMQWSPDRNAGFSKANPQKLYLPVIIDPEYHYEALNVESQERNPSSLLWWMKRIIAMRKQYKSFGRGNIKFVHSNNPKVIAFTREYNNEIMLIVINLSRFSQVVELELSEYAGSVPVEIFGENRFPLIKDSPYVITLGFHDYFWFNLEKKEEIIRIGDLFMVVPELSVKGSWEAVFYEKTKESLEKNILPSYISECRWFAGKGRRIQKVKITENITLGANSSASQLLLLEVNYSEGMPDVYLFPVSYSSGEKADRIIEQRSYEIIARIKSSEGEGILYEGIYDEDFQRFLFQVIAKRRCIRGRSGEISGYTGRRFKEILGDKKLPLSSNMLKAEQSNTSFVYEDVFFMKLYRRLEEGANPDPEMVRFLTEKRGFANIPPFAGAIEYRQRSSRQQITIACLQGYVSNQGDAWKFTQDSLTQYFEQVLSKSREPGDIPQCPASFFNLTFSEMPQILHELIGGFYLEMISLLGKRTGEMHLSLFSSEEPDFAPEPFSMLYQRSVYQSMRSLTARVIQLMKGNIKRLPEGVREEASGILEMEKEMMSSFQRILQKKISSVRTRFHGDFHLGQALFTGNDFIIIDFEGEPARPLNERRLKRSPLRDVAGMIRSFHYAAYTALLRGSGVRAEDASVLEQWAVLWYYYVSGIFLNSYLQSLGDAPILPREKNDLEMLLQMFVLEKAVYELGYELNNRPDWVIIPVKGIRHILKKPVQSGG